MTDTNQIMLGNENVRIRFCNINVATNIFCRLHRFLSPFFHVMTDNGERADLRIIFHSNQEFPKPHSCSAIRPIVIRKSTADEFNLSVDSHEDKEGSLHAWDSRWRTGYRINRKDNQVDFFASENSFIHLLEFVRYYSLLVEQARGTVILHAAAVIGPDGTIGVFCGAKGKGKTTTLLNYISDGKCRFFSGDKLLVNWDRCGRLTARGWPDYPHVGVGSLRQVPTLAGRMGVDLTDIDGTPLPDHKKLLIDPEQFYSVIPIAEQLATPISHIRFPDVTAGSQWKLVAGSPSVLKAIPNVIEFPSEFQTATWHGLIPEEPLRTTVPDSFFDALSQIYWYSQTSDEGQLYDQICHA